MAELKDSFGKRIEKGYIAFSLIGFSGSGCTQHIRKARVASNGAGYTLKTKVECPGHSYKRGTPLYKLINDRGAFSGACFCRMLTEKQFEKLQEKTALVFDKNDFKKICQRGK
jgi:hypothetical protein